jgi:hypothetical protein
MKKAILFIGVAMIVVSCSNKKNNISDFSWLSGKWSGIVNGSEFFEAWQPLQGNLLSGMGGAVMNNDTVFSEKIRIEQRGEDIFYTATVSENGGPVDFKFTGYKSDSLVFENQEHDFPQRVVYFKHSNDKLYACIDGKKSGVYSRMEFSLLKAK